MTMPTWLGAALASVAFAGAAHASDIQLTFDADAQGISAVGGTLSHDASGYLVQSDVDGGIMSLYLPSSLLGNWSRFLGGTLSFDAVNLSGVASDWGDFGRVTLTGAAGEVSFDLAPGSAPDARWTTFSADLTPANWGGNLSAVLANVTSVSVSLESHDGYGPANSEVNGFDNFKVSASAVPEPSTWALLATGLAVLACIHRRRSRH